MQREEIIFRAIKNEIEEINDSIIETIRYFASGSHETRNPIVFAGSINEFKKKIDEKVCELLSATKIYRECKSSISKKEFQEMQENLAMKTTGAKHIVACMIIATNGERGSEIIITRPLATPNIQYIIDEPSNKNFEDALKNSAEYHGIDLSNIYSTEFFFLCNFNPAKETIDERDLADLSKFDIIEYSKRLSWYSMTIKEQK